MILILDELENTQISDEIMSLWLDYENGNSKESVLAHQLDKFEMIVQAGTVLTI